MTVQKVTLTIKAEAMHPDALAGLLQEVITQMHGEKPVGNVKFDDGNCVEWSAKRSEPVEV